MSKMSIKSWLLMILGVLMLCPSILDAAVIGIPNISAPPGSNISIPIEIDDATGVFAVFVVLSYDPDVLTAIDASKAPLTSSFLIAHKIDTDRITLSLAGAQPLSGRGVLAKISFNVSQTAPVGSISELEVTTAELNEGNIKVTSSSGLFTITEGALITAPDTTAAVGSSITVPLTVWKGEDILSALIVVTYDENILTATGADLTPMTSGYAIAADVISGQISVSIAGSTSLTESGALVRIHFSVLPSAKEGDVSPLILSKVILNEETVFGNIINGSISLRAIRLPGDVTNNGKVTAYDAAKILQHTVGLLTLTGEDSVAAEVSGNDTISAYDASLVLHYVVGKITRFPAEEGQQSKLAYAPRRVWMGEPEVLPDGRMSLPILIDEMDGVVAGELTLSFTGDMGDVIVSTSELTSGYLFAHNVHDGRIRVSFAGAESSTGSGPVLEVVFDESDVGLLSSLRLERVSLNEGRIPVRIEGVEPETPTAYRLSQNYPNPFNPRTTITYDVAKPGAVRLSVYALTGQHIRTLVDGERPAGTYSVTWDGTDDTGREVASGVYLCRMEAGDYSASRKLVLMK